MAIDIDKHMDVSFGNDGVVIKKYLAGIEGGRNLNVDGFTPKVIKAGHVIIKNAAGTFKPMPVDADYSKYAALPDGYTPVGVLNASVLTETPQAPIMTAGVVNATASPCPVTKAIVEALSQIRFTNDEENFIPEEPESTTEEEPEPTAEEEPEPTTEE